MKFTFEALQDDDLIGGSSYFMDFGIMETQEDAAIAEGKLLSAFGDPMFTSENAEKCREIPCRESRGCQH